MKNEFVKTFPPFIIYLGTTIILLSFFKDMVLVEFKPCWLLMRVLYLPFILLVWNLSKKKLLLGRYYEFPLWAAGLYITLMCTLFSFDAGGLKSDYIFGLIQFYFAMAVMRLTQITFFIVSASSIFIYFSLNLINHFSETVHYFSNISTLIPLFIFSPIVYFITSNVRNSKIKLQTELTEILAERDQVIALQAKKMAEIETKETLSLIAVQMAHDIRSPLIALNILSSDTAQLPEKVRNLMRSTLNRINDIANNLLTTYKQKSDLIDMQHSSELLSVMVDSVVSEKRIQLQNSGIQLDYVIDISAQGVFSKI